MCEKLLRVPTIRKVSHVKDILNNRTTRQTKCVITYVSSCVYLWIVYTSIRLQTQSSSFRFPFVISTLERGICLKSVFHKSYKFFSFCLIIAMHASLPPASHQDGFSVDNEAEQSMKLWLTVMIDCCWELQYSAHPAINWIPLHCYWDKFIAHRGFFNKWRIISQLFAPTGWSAFKVSFHL